MENGFWVEWDYEYIPRNCDNWNNFETEAEAREFISKNKQFNPAFVARMWTYIDGVFEPA